MQRSALQDQPALGDQRMRLSHAGIRGKDVSDLLASAEVGEWESFDPAGEQVLPEEWLRR